MLKIIQFIINKIKGSDNYTFENNVTLSNLVNILFLRTLQIMRGMILKIFAWNIKGLLFVGRGVKIDFKKSIYSGKNLILEDRVYINGLSKKGIFFGKNCTVGREAIILSTGVIRNIGEGVKIGSNTAIGARNFISGQGGIEIGSDVIMGPDIRIFSENHNFLNSSKIIKDQGENRKGVKVGMCVGQVGTGRSWSKSNSTTTCLWRNICCLPMTLIWRKSWRTSRRMPGRMTITRMTLCGGAA